MLFYLFDLLKIVIQNLYLIIPLAGSSVGLSVFLVLVMCSYLFLCAFLLDWVIHTARESCRDNLIFEVILFSSRVNRHFYWQDLMGLLHLVSG